MVSGKRNKTQEAVSAKVAEFVDRVRRAEATDLHQVDLGDGEIDSLNSTLRVYPDLIGGTLFPPPPRWLRLARTLLDESLLADNQSPHLAPREEDRLAAIKALWDDGFSEVATYWNQNYRYDLHVKLPGYFLPLVSYETFEIWLEAWPRADSPRN